jgi:hypothetical protein
MAKRLQSSNTTTGGHPARRRVAAKGNSSKLTKMHDVMTLAAEAGLLRGPRSEVVRARMPKPLLEKARKVAGVNSDTELVEMALANLAVADQYMDWLVSQTGKVPQDIDLEF